MKIYFLNLESKDIIIGNFRYINFRKIYNAYISTIKIHVASKRISHSSSKSTWRGTIGEWDCVAMQNNVFVVFCTDNTEAKWWLSRRHFRTSPPSSPPPPMPTGQQPDRGGGAGRFTRRRPIQAPPPRWSSVSTKKGSLSDPSGPGRPLFLGLFKLSSPSSLCTLFSSLVLEGFS